LHQGLSREKVISSILVVDDHAFMRRGIKNLLAESLGWTVCGEAENGRDAIRLARELQPDVVLLDVSMPDITGIDATIKIRKRDSKVKIILLTLHDSHDLIQRAFQAGANGYLLKADAECELARALETVASDRTYLSPRIDRESLKGLIRNPMGTFLA
jgi:DNA-binding NarL/FixJ family response regulator